MRNPGIAERLDAVYQNIDILENYRPSPEYVVILAGDHVYKMNYAAMLVDHVEGNARMHGRLHRSAAQGRQRFWRDGRRCQRDGSPISSRSPPIRQR